ncbi:MAG: hypothetical protein JNM57_03150 [Cyclobacteriaceae bacterium]|nr:hypothetical protein [Cyclobacteriaceae bacterium]
MALLLGLLIHFNVNAQTTSPANLHENFSKYRESNLQEKIYVHLNQTFFLTGEILWFKLYLVEGTSNKPLDLSKVAYLEIIRDEVPLLQAKVEVKNGLGSGSLFLPATLLSGNYTVRAYTQWMRNYQPEFFFHQPITIVNTFKGLDVKPTSPVSKIDVQFFPEGGNLVDGIPSKVAFKISTQQGIPFSTRGAIVNEHNDTLTTFTPLKFGIGNFTFTPSLERPVKALVKDENGIIRSFDLPTIYPQGYVMSLADQSDQLTITITANTSPENIHLFAHNRQAISYSQTHVLANGQASFSIPKGLLGDGINHFTVFNQQFQPVCERLYFVQPKTQLEINLSASQQEYGTRRKVILDISTQHTNKPVETNLSLSVFRIDSLPLLERIDMLSYLYLAADLSGHIEAPEYYFSTDDKLVSEATDNLMMTHGWRRFKWENILSEKPTEFQFVPEYRGHIVKGVVQDLSGKPAAHVGTFVSVPGKNIRLYLSRSNELGYVQYEMKNFFGAQKIIAQTNVHLDSTYKIAIRSPFTDQPSRYYVPPFQLLPSIEKNLLDRAIAMQVQDVYYEDKMNRLKRTASDSTAFYGKADETYLLDDYTRFPIMEEVMREYVKGVWVRKRKDGFHFIVMDNVNQTVFDKDPLLLVDGVPAFNVNSVMELNPLKISKVEVLTRKYYLNDQSFPGIVSYTSYEGDMAGFQLDPKTVTLDYEGLQLQREFYSPKYENERQRLSRMPDQRTLLHWAPEINTINGKAQVEFYTSDLDGNFLIVVEGLSSTGKAGSAESQFKVIPRQK